MLLQCPKTHRHRIKPYTGSVLTTSISLHRSSKPKFSFCSQIRRFQHSFRSSYSDDTTEQGDALPTTEAEEIQETPIAINELLVEEEAAKEETPKEVLEVEEPVKKEAPQEVVLVEEPVKKEIPSEEIAVSAVAPTAATETTEATEKEAAPVKAVGPVGCPEGFTLNFYWLKANLVIAVDQIFSKDQRSPLTDYYVWPKNDAWEEIRKTLKANPWISESDQVCLLNRVTEVINYWQEGETRHTLEEARSTFPDCVFMGA
eukprot:g6885.t1